MEANNMKAMREASAPVPCDHVLTLDEAIAHAEECADNTPCGSQHRQLADWLKELKTLKTSVSCGNFAKMREALEKAFDTIQDFICGRVTREQIRATFAIIRSALGTASKGSGDEK